jgi:hypothetical protein
MSVRGEVGQDMFSNCSVDGFGLQSAHFIAVCSEPLLQDGIDDVGLVVELGLGLTKSCICSLRSLWTERNCFLGRVRSSRRAWSPAPRRLDR